MPRLLVLCLLLPLLVGCGGDTGSNPPAAGPQAEAAPGKASERGLIRAFAGMPPPAVAIETGTDGATTTLAEVIAGNAGRPVLVNLWATWCAPCLKELPTLDALAAETRGRLLVLPVSQDMEGWRKVGPAFTAEKYPNLQTMLESQTLLGAALKAEGLPLTILYGADGREAWRYAGDRDWNSAESRALIGVGGAPGGPAG